MKTIIAIIVVILLAAGGWYAYTKGMFGTPAAAPAAVGASDTVAVVNGENIIRGDLDTLKLQLAAQAGAQASSTEAQAQLQTQALNSLISQVLLRQAAANSGVVASSTEVEKQMAAAKAQFKSDAEYQQALTTQGLTEDTLRAQITKNLTISAYLDKELKLSSITATEAEIKTAYDTVAKAQTGVPPLAQVKDQVKNMVIQQKQQVLIDAQVAKLRAAGNVQVLI